MGDDFRHTEIRSEWRIFREARGIFRTTELTATTERERIIDRHLTSGFSWGKCQFLILLFHIPIDFYAQRLPCAKNR